MEVVITNAGDIETESVIMIAEFLEEKVSRRINISNVVIGKAGETISFEMKSSDDPFPEDYQMRILTNMFSGSNLEFLIPKTGFRWMIA